MKRASSVGDAAAVFVTAGSMEQAEAIANALVSERLAACANIVSPVRSIYRWKEEIQNDLEHLMIIKTRADLVARIESRVKELHSYEAPEVIALPIIAGSKSYLEWVFESTAVLRLLKSRRTTARKPRK